MQGYVTGLGKPWAAMILLILYYIVFRIPAAYWLSEISGLAGIWGAFLVSHVMAFAVAIYMTIDPGRSLIMTTKRIETKFN